MNVTIYTDGACIGNPGPGGWAAIILTENSKKENQLGHWINLKIKETYIFINKDFINKDFLYNWKN